ncbi:general transcription factor 3C polypeptide 6 [Echinops telfairi]|uniref:General transcription factor 3C polypeptide 6 n=1 Tax=Echinops telfairi TaxID=9371 RepID=A0AC55DFM3_ECHTE|nr:general transcription factor 3C polypeptide 6 [Echinops telfairi]
MVRTAEHQSVAGATVHQIPEQLVLVELSGIIDSDFLSKCENKCKILGIDTEKPIMQVDNYVFAGEYEDTLGTCVIFEEDGEEHVELYFPRSLWHLSQSCVFSLGLPSRPLKLGGVEWLRISDSDSSNRPSMICSFLHEDEDMVASAPHKSLELKEQDIHMKDNSDLSYDQEKPLHLDIGDSSPLIEIPSFDTEGFVFMDSQDGALEATPR